MPSHQLFLLYIRVKTLKLTLVTAKGNLILIGEMNRSCFIIKMPNDVTVSDKVLRNQ